METRDLLIVNGRLGEDGEHWLEVESTVSRLTLTRDDPPKAGMGNFGVDWNKESIWLGDICKY